MRAGADASNVEGGGFAGAGVLAWGWSRQLTCIRMWNSGFRV